MSSAANGILIVGIAVDVAGLADAGTTASVTAGGVSMNSVQRWESGGSAQHAGFVQAYKLVSPPTGSITISVAISGTAADGIGGGSLSWTGADQTTGIGTAYTGDSNGTNVTSASISVSTTTSGNQCAAFITNGSQGITWTAGTKRWDTGYTAGGAAADDSSGATLASTGGSTTFSWTQTSDFYGAIAFEVLAAGGGPGYMPQQQLPPYYQRLIR